MNWVAGSSGCLEVLWGWDQPHSVTRNAWPLWEHTLSSLGVRV